MKRPIVILMLVLLSPFFGFSQSDPHYTMFMYNKLLYNPAYAGARDATCVNLLYRDQWDGIPGAPKTFNVSFDAPLGRYTQPFRRVATGASFTSEVAGAEHNNEFAAYYSYRIKLKRSVVSFGLQAAAKLYSVNYDELEPYQQYDPNLVHNVRNQFLPNFGAGIYKSSDKYYVGFSAPHLIQNYYDKGENSQSSKKAKEVRGFYLNGGYTYKVNTVWELLPQVMCRYAGNSTYSLPFSADINLTAVAYSRVMAGITFRTDKSLEAIIHVQATRSINIGYSYDYVMSALTPYARGSHELILGYDFRRENVSGTSPRFLRPFAERLKE